MYETETIESQAQVPNHPAYVCLLSVEADYMLLCKGTVRSNPLKGNLLSVRAAVTVTHNDMEQTAALY